MSDNMNQESNQDSNQSDQAPGELDLLKSRARMMGISFSNNIGLDALKAKIQARMDGTSEQEEVVESIEDLSLDNPLTIGAQGNTQNNEVPVRRKTLSEYLHDENMMLLRCRITNLDPKKKDLPGEIITVANEFLGTVKKFVPYGEHTENGYHIPKCIYEMLRSRKFLNIRITRDKRTGTEKVSQSWAQEFAIEVMDPLTDHELKQLAQAQIAAGSIAEAEAA